MAKARDVINRLSHTGALHITLGTFLTKFVAFFGSIVVVRLLTKSDYGIMGYVDNIVGYASLFAGLGLFYALLRYVIIADDLEKKYACFDYVIKKGALRNAIIYLTVIALNFSVPYPENFSEARFWVPIAALLIPLTDFGNALLHTVRAFFENKLYAYASLLVSVALILGRLIGAWGWGIGGVFGLRVAITFLFSVGGYIWIKNKFFPNTQKAPLSGQEIREMNLYALQYMITNGFWALFMMNDTFLIGLLLNDPMALADYKVAYFFPGNLSLFSTAIGMFVGPHFTKNEKNILWVRQRAKKVFLITVIIIGSAALGLLFLAVPLIKFVYGEQYLSTVGIMRWLLLASFLNSGVRYTFANILAAMGIIKYNMILSALGIVFQLILDVLLIPRFGVTGAAVTNCVVYLFMSITICGIFYKLYYKNERVPA